MCELQRVLFVALLGVATIGCTVGNDDEISSPASKKGSTEIDVTGTTDEPFTLEEGFTQLTLDDFAIFPETPKGETPIWTTDDGTSWVCTGAQRGYAYTREHYGDFTLRLEFRYPQPSAPTDDAPPNTGFLIYVPDEHKVWPASLEVQGRQDEMGQIKSNSRDLQVSIDDDEAARKSSRKKPGEWNSIEIVSRDGALISYLNGTQICTSEPTELKSGSIGLQSERFEVQFRRVRIRED